MARTFNGRFDSPEEPKVQSGYLIAGLIMIPTWASFFTLVASICCFVKYGKQVKEHRLFERFHRYCSVIGPRRRVSIRELKKAAPDGTGVSEVREDLQKMLYRGYFGERAFIDMGRDELVLADGIETPHATGHARTWKDLIADALDLLRGEQLFQEAAQPGDFEPGDFDYEEVAYAPAGSGSKKRDEKEKKKAEKREEAEPAPEAKPKRAAKPARPTYAEELERTLNELYQLNENIEDEAVSKRIDRIGTLTAGIFRAVIERPEREQDVRKFMNYYLPTTLKLLRSYDMLEDQKVQSQNIAESREKIENVLDMLIRAYERQLDRLYRDDALDIATDIDVLESMMAGDGLSSKLEMPGR